MITTLQQTGITKKDQLTKKIWTTWVLSQPETTLDNMAYDSGGFFDEEGNEIFPTTFKEKQQLIINEYDVRLEFNNLLPAMEEYGN